MSVSIRRVLCAATALLAAGVVSQAQALQVSVGMSGISLDGDSNFSDPTRSSAHLLFSREQQVVTGDFGPLFDTVHAEGSANGIGGTLGASISASNPSGTAGEGTQRGGRIVSLIRENIRVVQTATGVPEGFHSGLVGLGDTNDDFWTVRASVSLFGTTSVGRATGVPEGRDPGSAKGELVLNLGLNGVKRGGLFQSEETTKAGTTHDKLVTESNTGGVSVSVNPSSNTVTMVVPKDLLTSGTIFFEAQLSAEFTAGDFEGAEQQALFGHTAYLDFQVEDGAAWRPSSRVNHDFLSAPIPPPGTVPLPAAAWFALSGLGLIGTRLKRA